MTVPSTTIQKVDFQTGVVSPSDEGVLAIIAPSEKGTANVAVQYTRADVALDDLGYGKLVEFGAYDMNVAKRPIVAVKATGSTAGTYGTVTKTGTGTFTPTAGATEPLDDYDVVIDFPTGGALGTAGIAYTYSLDGGLHTSAKLALGTALSITIPNTGISVTLGTAAQTVAAGDSVTFTTTGQKLQSTDLTGTTGPLEALRVTQAPWEGVLVHGDADGAMVDAIDSWLQTLESQGKFRFAIVNSRFKSAGETDSAYQTALDTLYSAHSTIRACVGADGGDLTSPISGVVQPRPTSLFLAARAMSTDIAVDAAFVGDGPLDKVVIVDDRGNPRYHDEYLHPGLDDLRLAALRTIPGETGAFVNNPRVLSPTNSDFVYLQHVRVMNRACETAFQVLTKRLSKGVRKQRKPDPITGAVYIVEEDALDLESAVNTQLAKVLKGRASGFKFSVSRTDDIGSNAGATITCTLAIAGLAYIKNFTVKAQFVRAI